MQTLGTRCVLDMRYSRDLGKVRSIAYVIGCKMLPMGLQQRLINKHMDHSVGKKKFSHTKVGEIKMIYVASCHFVSGCATKDLKIFFQRFLNLRTMDK